MNKKIELSKRPAAMVDLENWCIMSAGREDKGDFLEVTEWTNGEGYDIHISDVDGQKNIYLNLGSI